MGSRRLVEVLQAVTILHRLVKAWYKFWKFRGTACAFSVLETYVEAGRSPSIQSYLLAKAQEGGTGSADVVSIQQMLRKLLEVM